MKRRLFTLAAGLTVAIFVSAGPALAVIPGVPDQHQDTYSGASAGVTGTAQLDAQLFTAGITGGLTAVQLYVNDAVNQSNVVAPNAVGGVTVSIRNVVSGHPDATDLVSLSATVGIGWNLFLFAGSVPVTSGTQYAIVMTPDSNQKVFLGGSCTAGDYTGGGAQVFDSTWKTVPSFDDASCIVHWAFSTNVLAAATPTATAPATTDVAGSSTQSDGTALPLFMAAIFGAIAFVTLRRSVLTRR